MSEQMTAGQAGRAGQGAARDRCQARGFAGRLCHQSQVLASTHKQAAQGPSAAAISVPRHPTAHNCHPPCHPPTHSPTCGAAQCLHAGQAAHDGVPLGHLACAQGQAGGDDGGQALGDRGNSQRHSHLRRVREDYQHQQHQQQSHSQTYALLMRVASALLLSACCLPLIVNLQPCSTHPP